MRKRELVFLQLRLNGSSEDFSAISYLLFSSFQDFLRRCGSGGWGRALTRALPGSPLTGSACSPDRAGFMQACESAYSSWRFSGGFRTWVKMSLVKTQEEDGREAVEFRQEVGGSRERSTCPS